MYRVYLDHQLVGAHPAGSTARLGEPSPIDPMRSSLIVSESGGQIRIYEADQWDAAGEDLPCGGKQPDPDCWRCHRPRPSPG